MSLVDNLPCPLHAIGVDAERRDGMSWIRGWVTTSRASCSGKRASYR
jgi:hypothetical protein